MATINVKLDHARDTKGTHFYSTDDPNAVVKSVYIQKGTFEGNRAPDQITLTLTSTTTTR